MYPAAPPQVPERRGWPISVWIVPDLLLGFALTLLLTLLVVAVSIALRIASGELLLADGGLRFANGTLFDTAKDVITPGVFILSLLAQNLAFAAVVALRVRVLRKLPWEWLALRAKRPTKLALSGVGLGFGFLVLNFISSYIFSTVLGIEQDQAAQFPIRAGDVGGQILVVVAAVAIAPIGEELLFRGYIFHAIQENMGKPAAYIVSSLLFSLVHIFGVTQGAVALLVPLFFGGLLLALGVDRSKSLIPCIIAHAINNGLAMTALLTCTNNPGLCPAT
jgi:membrane protease YdiL (CAAX protease family)